MSGPTVGIEEELLLVDPATHRLAPHAERVLAAMGADEGQAHPDTYDALVELASPPASGAAEAAAALAGLRRRVRDAGGTLIGAGLHPDARMGETGLVEAGRAGKVAEAMRGLVERTPECALHVHVGVPGPEDAVRAVNGLREHVPLLHALAANSPLWFGRDSRMASARAAMLRSYPRTGVPRAFHDRADYDEAVAATLAAGELPDESLVWWDVRIRPRIGTVEVRGMDAQFSLRATRAIAALVRGLAAAAVADPPAPPVPREALAESAFRAARDGVGATLLDRDGRLRPVPELARAAMERARPHLGDPGDERALEDVAELAAAGGADRQRRALGDGGLPGLLAMLVRETAAGQD